MELFCEIAVALQGLGGVVLTQAVKAQDLHANWAKERKDYR